MSARDGALTEAERLRHENVNLLRRLMEMKEGEAGRLNDINRMHEELLEQATRMRQEAELDRQATELIRQRAVAAALSSVAAVGALGQPASAASSVLVAAPQLAALGPAPLAPDAAGGGGATGASSGEWVGAVGAAQPGGVGGLSMPMSLRDVMGMLAGSPSQRGGGGAVGTAGMYGTVLRPPELRMPTRVPLAVVAVAHKGGCNSLAAQFPGHFVASCGADRTVALWDVATISGALGTVGGGGGGGGGSRGGSSGHVGPAISLMGMTAAVNDCAFTCDAAQVVAAGSDRALLVWDATSGRHRHTLTGHTGPVTAVALSPLDCRLAVSVSEDRSFKLWDLSRGFSVRSVPCAKMPLCLALSTDGNTVVTGELGSSTAVLGGSRNGSLAFESYKFGSLEPRPRPRPRSLKRYDITHEHELINPSITHTYTHTHTHTHSYTHTRLTLLSCSLLITHFVIPYLFSFNLWTKFKQSTTSSCQVCRTVGLFLATVVQHNTPPGHLDGSVLLWDVRQCRAGTATPLVEHHDQNQPVVCLAALPSNDSVLMLATRDGSLRLWDFRGATTMRLWRQPGFSLGTCGGTGRPRCHLGISADGRLLAAGAADGSVWVWDLRNAGAGPGAGADPKQLRGGPGGSPVHQDSVVATAFSSDMTALLSADKAGGLAFWQME
ncbi:hypothetical protein Vafri_13255 [Volvox africanus]|uniref:Guanine nucleotide-binding protein subunit beta-like protein n=1 Tax=Volvox africanus TaxID=51714 RepID=A0A8J4BBM6_9CHLO|nr:hypothetical protein Vafri_13255 [Volvox africanus]